MKISHRILNNIINIAVYDLFTIINRVEKNSLSKKMYRISKLLFKITNQKKF